jgi:hypothetical protein
MLRELVSVYKFSLRKECNRRRLAAHLRLISE